jgi:Na+-translocating ferredoxin:NAD+ oxidoreductase subunit G
MDTRSDLSRPRSPVRAAAALIGIVAILTAALALLAGQTRDRILANQQSALLQAIAALLPPGSYDNDILKDRIAVRSDLLGSPNPVQVFRARRDGQPVAVLINAIAPDGYRGPIELLIAINYDGALYGVQVLDHDETPGLGDAFENREADWLTDFRGRSLENPAQARWTVRKDGGDFDAFTGATITPRAIVKAVRKSLEYYRTRREALFEDPSES